VTEEDRGHETGPTAELARLRRVEAAARDLLNRSQGRRSATQMLEGMAALRATLEERPHGDIQVGARTLMDEAFGHHVWATTRLIDACFELSPEQLETALPGTYGSILETMRHLVGSDAWYLFDITGDRHRRIEAESMDLTALRAEMEADGASWSRFLAEDPAPGAVLKEVDESDGFEREATIGIRLAQALHHGTDHRSQICTALTSLGIEPPGIDAWNFGLTDGSVAETYPTI
jgi:uncharacterized damage-inducible protein DinB